MLNFSPENLLDCEGEERGEERCKPSLLYLARQFSSLGMQNTHAPVGC